MKANITKQVNKDIEAMKINDKVLFNSIKEENITLKNAIIENLSESLVEQDCGGGQVYEWLLTDYKECVCEEDLVRLTEKRYSKKGELEYNNNFSFDENQY